MVDSIITIRGISFTITALVAEGAMGKVYKGAQVNGRATCAVKTANQPSYEKFIHLEYEYLRELSHPNSVRVFGLDQTLHVLVLEFLEGQNLRQKGEDGLTIESILRVGCEVAEALEEAHSKKILHRDVKPDNIILTEYGAKLIDFGLATTQEQQRERAICSNGHMRLVGTPMYMAPEQFMAQEVPASDIYALGMTLYECISGKHPFIAPDSYQLMECHMQVIPKRLKTPNPLLGLLISEMLRKDHRHRPSAACVKERLRSLI
jgi:serine/threonine-protein kinase